MSNIHQFLIKFLFSLLIVGIGSSCSDDDEVDGTSPDDNSEVNIIPERFSVEIPPSFTRGTAPNGRSTNNETATDDDLSGNSIYEAMGYFIKLGEESAEIVEEIIGGIRFLNITGITAVTYESDDDGRTKNLEVLEGGSYDGVAYEFQLIVTDAESESNDDGGRAMQIFWNTDPIGGVAILKPYNIDREEFPEAIETLYRIEYQEEGSLGYEAHMIVTITDLPLADEEVDPFSVDNLKMFAGKTGNTVDLYGNSNHPNATFFTDEKGFNWAFVASGDDVEDLGVAEVGLPPSTLNSTDRATILETYALKQVFSDQLLEVFPLFTQELLDTLLVNTEAPGYFSNEGFVSAGDSPGSEWDSFADRIEELTPFNPSEVSTLTLDFQ